MDGRKVRGEIIASDKAEVERQLASRCIIVRRLRRTRSFFNTRNTIDSRDVMSFARQMATMIRAGVPILQALQTVADGHGKASMAALVKHLTQQVMAGSSFSEALANHPRYFDRLFVGMIETGEQSGTLDHMLERVASHREKVESLKARVKKALYYPAAVVAVGSGVTLLLLVKVVPQFESLFHGFDAELPAMTRMTIAFSAYAQAYWPWAMAIAFGIPLTIRRTMRRSEAFTHRMHALALAVPVIGKVLDNASVARYSRTLSTTVAAGVPLVEALESAAGTAGNKVYERAILRIRTDIASGQPLHAAMRSTRRFPPLAVQMVCIGEESGALDSMLDRVASYHEEMVDNQVDTLTSLLEPVVIVVLGMLVGGLIVAMYLPIFELGGVF